MNFFDLAIAVINLMTTLILSMSALGLAVVAAIGLYCWRNKK
jgi:hypothetical protein